MNDGLIVGVDPSLNSTGIAIVKSKNNSFELIKSICIRHKKDDQYFQKLTNILNEVRGFLRTDEVNCMAIEETFLNKNPRLSLTLGVVRGIIISVALSKDIPVFEYSPRLIKNIIVGKGSATKDQVEFMIYNMMNRKKEHFPNITQDETDAIAIAITHSVINRSRKLGLIT